jgi:hypothetical protein
MGLFSKKLKKKKKKKQKMAAPYCLHRNETLTRVY